MTGLSFKLSDGPSRASVAEPLWDKKSDMSLYGGDMVIIPFPVVETHFCFCPNTMIYIRTVVRAPCSGELVTENEKRNQAIGVNSCRNFPVPGTL